MTHPSDIAAIAKGLTKAQRDMIVAIGDGQSREFSLGRTGFALIDRGLVFINELGARHLSDDGNTVRRYLQENPNA